MREMFEAMGWLRCCRRPVGAVRFFHYPKLNLLRKRLRQPGRNTNKKTPQPPYFEYFEYCVGFESVVECSC
jgi:hypothetical protein